MRSAEPTSGCTSDAAGNRRGTRSSFKSEAKDRRLESFGGRVSDSGEGRWTIKASIDERVPSPVLTSALHERFSSRGNADYADRLLSAMRYAFGGHEEKEP